jgi:hypothetical protein
MGALDKERTAARLTKVSPSSTFVGCVGAADRAQPMHRDNFASDRSALDLAVKPRLEHLVGEADVFAEA